MCRDGRQLPDRVLDRGDSGFLSLAVLIILAVREPERPQAARACQLAAAPRRARAPRPRRTGGVVRVAAVFTLARFSEAFLMLRARRRACGSCCADGAGRDECRLFALGLSRRRLADDGGRYACWRGRRVADAADLVLAFASRSAASAGVVLWGLHMGFTQGLFAALVADTAPPSGVARPSACSTC